LVEFSGEIHVFFIDRHCCAAAEIPGDRAGRHTELAHRAVAVCACRRWWAWADASGYTKRKEIEKMEKRKQDRIDKQRDAMGMLSAKKRKKVSLPGIKSFRSRYAIQFIRPRVKTGRPKAKSP
jgi:hypothetical protein